MTAAARPERTEIGTDLAALLAEHGVGQVVPVGDDGGWDVRDVPPEVIAAIRAAFLASHCAAPPVRAD